MSFSTSTLQLFIMSASLKIYKALSTKKLRRRRCFFENNSLQLKYKQFTGKQNSDVTAFIPCFMHFYATKFDIYSVTFTFIELQKIQNDFFHSAVAAINIKRFENLL